MHLTRHLSPTGPRWAADGTFLAEDLRLADLLRLTRSELSALLQAALVDGQAAVDGQAEGALLPPLESVHEVWASGVTYLRSREARTAESSALGIYERVYEAERPELFFKATGRRAVGDGQPIRIRRDAGWHVPEPELTLVVNCHLEIVGYTAGNDVSSRDIEGENPLYLPQAKTFDGSCAVGPAIVLASAAEVADLPIRCVIERGTERVFEGETRTSQMKRSATELVGFLGRELSFPDGVLLMTGTGIVPPDGFTLGARDRVMIEVGMLTLTNEVE